MGESNDKNELPVFSCFGIINLYVHFGRYTLMADRHPGIG